MYKECRERVMNLSIVSNVIGDQFEREKKPNELNFN